MNKKRNLAKKAMIYLTIFLMLIILVGCSQPSHPASTGGQEQQEKTTSETLTISAAASLTDVMEEIKKLYEENSVHSLEMNYASSGALQQQIEQGAPADVFISAAQRQMDTLEKKDLIMAESRMDLLQNAVVLMVPATERNKEITGFHSLTADNIRVLAIGEPEGVPAGRYAKELLNSLDIWDPLEEKLILAKDVRQVSNYVETGNADAGIVYMTDAMSSNQVEVIAAAPDGSHTPVTYPAAITSNTSSYEAAADFMTFLQSEEAIELFEKSGFTFIAGK